MAAVNDTYCCQTV